ncbi:MAG: methionyl-tRNA formyltransferase [Rhodocyclaceae bacterium]|nr:methionyl-tRNA formyltransferase [Rhodocyclaceae bacterium]MBX3667834.1 methionyl-tRNA formyltransferase [Rhodocyclaceae bacterium]
MSGLSVAFAGTPEFAARALAAIVSAGYPVPLVLTQPDRPAGRGQKLTASPVKQYALAHGLAVAQPERLRTPEQRAVLAGVTADVLVVAAYGLILPQVVLDWPRLGCVNIHASLLPRWRGAAPIQRAIEAGDAETGITIMQMDAGLDTGPMLLARSIAITATDNAASLHDRLAALGAQLVVEALAGIENGTMSARAQPEAGVTYAQKIAKSEAVLDFRQSADLLARRVRAFDPFPGASASAGPLALKIRAAHALPLAGEPGRLLAAGTDGIVIGCGSGALAVTQLQLPGGRRLAAADFLAGHALPAGTCFDLPGSAD